MGGEPAGVETSTPLKLEARMLLTDKTSAKSLALAFLRKTPARTRFQTIERRCEETDACWIFDFYHLRWNEYRDNGAPYGIRIAVDKQTGKARHYAALKKEKCG